VVACALGPGSEVAVRLGSEVAVTLGEKLESGPLPVEHPAARNPVRTIPASRKSLY
jgi:hypothetical protein